MVLAAHSVRICPQYTRCDKSTAVKLPKKSAVPKGETKCCHFSAKRGQEKSESTALTVRQDGTCEPLSVAISPISDMLIWMFHGLQQGNHEKEVYA